MNERDPETLQEAQQQIAQLRAQLGQAHQEAIAFVLTQLHAERADFYFNEANDYGVIRLSLDTGSGDPWALYRGEEITARYPDGVRGTGLFRLNEALVSELLRRFRAPR